VSRSARLTPFVALGFLALAIGAGIGLGIAEAPSASSTFTVVLPASNGASSVGIAVPIGTTCHQSGREAGGTLVRWVCTWPG